MSKDKELVLKLHVSDGDDNASVKEIEVPMVGNNGSYSIPKAEVDKFFNTGGISKPTRKRIKDLETQLVTDGFNFLKERVVAEGNTVSLKFQDVADNKQTLSVAPYVMRPEITRDADGNFHRGEPIPKFGVCRITGKRTIPSVLRRDGELISNIESVCEKHFASKVKKKAADSPAVAGRL